MINDVLCNLVPCVLISFMTLLGFLLPPDSGEKLTLRKTTMIGVDNRINFISSNRNYNTSVDCDV